MLFEQGHVPQAAGTQSLCPHFKALTPIRMATLPLGGVGGGFSPLGRVGGSYYCAKAAASLS